MERRRLLMLTVLMVVYLCIGAAVFNALEANNEKERKNDLERDIDRFLGNNSCVSRQALHKLLFKASQDGELVYYILHNKTHLDRWDFSGAFGFSISVVTTIGFGNLAPHTMEGKVVVVIYAIMGIPLMLLLLAGIGEKLMLLFKRISKLKVCSTKPQVNRVVNALLIVVLGMVVGFVAPATLFHFIEEWHFLEALYFCFTTLSTIGFGDYIIGIHERKISEGALHETYEVVAYVWILFGLAYVSLSIKYISDLLLHNAKKMEKTVKKLEGTRLFRKVSDSSSKEDMDISAAPRLFRSSSAPDLSTATTTTTSSSSSSSSTRCILSQPGKSPPPTYSMTNGALSVSTDRITTERSGGALSTDEAPGCGVELLNVNHI
ncbi:potassium channel, subfamily K, member 16-like [Babylonia areolata]|uniref:potassium channel, subfamily K, member 16-like n=1 Tax=Babylonia areolata TaxID=304850 RepID=UPI003FD4F275